MIIRKENAYITDKEALDLETSATLLEARLQYSRHELYNEIQESYKKIKDFEEEHNITEETRKDLPPDIKSQYKELMQTSLDLIEKDEKQETLIHSLTTHIADKIQTIKDRYIEAVRGNEEQIMADCFEILDALTKEDIKKSITAYKSLKYGDNIPPEAKKQSFKGAVWHILQILQLQIDALLVSDIPIGQAFYEMVEVRAASFYKRPEYRRRTTQADDIQEIEVIQAEQNALTTPTSKLLRLPDILFLSGGNIDTLKLWVSLGTNKDLTYKVGISDFGQTQITATTRNGKEEYSASVPPGISKYKTSVYTIFHYLLMKYNDTNNIYITYDMLVEDGVFTNEQAARNDFRKCLEALQLTTIQYSRKKGKPYSLVMPGEERGGKERSRGNLISRIDDDFTSAFMVHLNPDLNWKEITAQFTNIPGYFFYASSLAKRIINLVFETARRRRENCFRIPFATLYRYTLIKKIDSHAKRNIIEPISDAIQEINELHKDTYNADYDMLTLDLQGTTPKDIINNSFVYVEIREKELTEIIDRVKHRRLKIQESQKKKQLTLMEAKQKQDEDKSSQ